jgi:tRNA threonylcarbamoyl adenosine modification protein YeaZ
MTLRTLALDTSTPHGSVAVLEGETILFAEEFVADRSHSCSLFSVLERAQAIGAPFGLIAVGLGPGSYAGVRIAIAAAMGLSLASGAPMVGLPSVAALACGKYAAIGDARRDTFYWTLVEEGLCRVGPELVSAEELQTRLNDHQGRVLASETLLSAERAYPAATILGALAASGRGIIARDQLEPIYLREPHITQPKPR